MLHANIGSWARSLSLFFDTLVFRVFCCVFVDLFKRWQHLWIKAQANPCVCLLTDRGGCAWRAMCSASFEGPWETALTGWETLPGLRWTSSCCFNIWETGEQGIKWASVRHLKLDAFCRLIKRISDVYYDIYS